MPEAPLTTGAKELRTISPDTPTATSAQLVGSSGLFPTAPVERREQAACLHESRLRAEAVVAVRGRRVQAGLRGWTSSVTPLKETEMVASKQGVYMPVMELC